MSTKATNSIDAINDKVTKFYPLSLPAKHLEKRIPATLTMNKVVLYYTFWNWIILCVALVTSSARIRLYSQSSSLLVACVIALAWIVLGLPFFKQFYGGILKTETNWLIILADALVHFAPIAIMGLPTHFAIALIMPLLTFWIWYMAMRPRMMALYGDITTVEKDASFGYDGVALGGTLIWLFVIVVNLGAKSLK